MSHFEKRCQLCSRSVSDPAQFACPDCQEPLVFHYDLPPQLSDPSQPGMWRYWRLLPVDSPPFESTLYEGRTPLLPSRSFSSHRVWLKDETRNPTGSHKDRPLALAIEHARRLGAETSFVVSTGSTGISNAALAARAGMKSVCLMTAGTPDERVYPMYAYGSTIVQVEGAVDDVIDQVIHLCRQNNLYLSSTSRGSNPYQGEANKTIAYELYEAMEELPEWVVVPVGGGGTISGIRRGFDDLARMGLIDRLPRLVGVLPQDYDILRVAHWREMEDWFEVVQLDYDERPPSLLIKLAHNYPPDGWEAIEAVRHTQGHFLAVSDAEALEAQDRFAREEGIYVEPSTGACLAGVKQLLASEKVAADDRIVAIVSGSGYRENFVTMEMRPLQKQEIASDELEETLLKLAGS